MLATELRIGNILTTGNYEVKVIEIHHLGVQVSDLEETQDTWEPYVDRIKPMPLTEEWLLKFGFEKNENGLFKLFNESEVPILLNEDLNGWTCDGINFSVNGTQYIHQLQNLYFALTGEELTLKSE